MIGYRAIFCQNTSEDFKNDLLKMAYFNNLQVKILLGMIEMDLEESFFNYSSAMAKLFLQS